MSVDIDKYNIIDIDYDQLKPSFGQSQVNHAISNYLHVYQFY